MKLGSALACFERSTLPSHAGRRAVVLRILEIVRPVALAAAEKGYAGRVEPPRAGELLMVAQVGDRRKRKRKPTPWAFDLDKKGDSSVRRMLRLLWAD